MKTTNTTCICGCQGRPHRVGEGHVDLSLYSRCPARKARKARAAAARKAVRGEATAAKKAAKEAAKQFALVTRNLVTLANRTLRAGAIETGETAYETIDGRLLRTHNGEDYVTYVARKAARDAAKRGHAPGLTDEENARAKEIYRQCWLLNKEAGCTTFHVDHIHPLAKGGTHHPDNLQILTAEENLKKGARV